MQQLRERGGAPAQAFQQPPQGKSWECDLCESAIERNVMRCAGCARAFHLECLASDWNMQVGGGGGGWGECVLACGLLAWSMEWGGPRVRPMGRGASGSWLGDCFKSSDARHACFKSSNARRAHSPPQACFDPLTGDAQAAQVPTAPLASSGAAAVGAAAGGGTVPRHGRCPACFHEHRWASGWLASWVRRSIWAPDAVRRGTEWHHPHGYRTSQWHPIGPIPPPPPPLHTRGCACMACPLP